MTISDILQMLIDFKNKKSAYGEQHEKKRTTINELITQHLHYHKAFEEKRSFFFWLDEVAKKAMMEQFNEKIILFKTSSQPKVKDMLKLLSIPPLTDDPFDENPAKPFSLPTLEKEDKHPQKGFIHHPWSMAHDDVHAWVNTEYSRPDSRIRYPFRWENFFQRKNNMVTTYTEFIANLKEWLQKKMDKRPLAETIGYYIHNKNGYDWDINTLYKLPARPSHTNTSPQTWRERFLQEGSTLVPFQKKSRR